MFSIGEIAKQTDVKIPTIRYYESVGLLSSIRTEGNQRRYTQKGLERLSFIKHARSLGFSLESISSLIELQEHPDRSCSEATDIARTQLDTVREKIKKLNLLEQELTRISIGCSGNNVIEDCYVLSALADHSLCTQDH